MFVIAISLGGDICLNRILADQELVRIVGWPRSQPSLRRAAETDPHPGSELDAQDSGVRRIRVAHDHRCLPGEGRELKARTSDAGEAGVPRTTRGTPARDRAPAQRLSLGSQAEMSHPTACPPAVLCFRVRRSRLRDQLTAHGA